MIEYSLGFYKHDFSIIPWVYNQGNLDSGAWLFVINWFGFELSIHKRFKEASR